MTRRRKTKLFTLLGSYPNAMALKNGAVTSDLVDFDFADVKVSNTAFKPLVREAKFDVARAWRSSLFCRPRFTANPMRSSRRRFSAAASTIPSPTIRNAGP